MRLSIVTPAPEYLGIARTCPGIHCVISKVQPWVLTGTAGDIFLVNPRVGSRHITPGAFGQSTGICGHPRVLDFRLF